VITQMPNRKAKLSMIAEKRAAAQKRDADARKAELKKEGARLRTQTNENDLVGKPSVREWVRRRDENVIDLEYP